MTLLYSEDEIRDMFVHDIEVKVAEETSIKKDRETAERMIRDGALSLDKIALYVPSLTMEELKALEAEVMQPA